GGGAEHGEVAVAAEVVADLARGRERTCARGLPVGLERLGALALRPARHLLAAGVERGAAVEAVAAVEVDRQPPRADEGADDERRLGGRAAVALPPARRDGRPPQRPARRRERRRVGGRGGHEAEGVGLLRRGRAEEAHRQRSQEEDAGYRTLDDGTTQLSP